MRNPADFALRLEYEWVKDLRDKLVDIGDRLNWESFRPTLESIRLDKEVWAEMQRQLNAMNLKVQTGENNQICLNSWGALD